MAERKLETLTRRRVRDFIYQTKLIERIVRDIQNLLEVLEEERFEADQIYLWDDKEKLVKHGVNYREME
ncbi:MAG: hypothetical protein LUH14_04685 [Clostridiaceae bacterium]|nr:hypothetical protein [Clostridiaceae bacterium]